MDFEERIKRHEETQQRLREDIEWLRRSKFTVGKSGTEDLVDENERIISMYDQMIEELRKRLA